jgi:hypothetical protein
MNTPSLALCAILALGLGLTVADDSPLPDLRKLAGKLDKGGTLTPKEAAEFVKKYEELGDVMNLFKAKKLGYEKVIMDLAREKGVLSPAELARRKKALVEMAELNVAVAELLPAYRSTWDAARLKQWKAYARRMKEGSQALRKAAEGKDPAGVQKAAERLNDSCIDCHRKFRD